MLKGEFLKMEFPDRLLDVINEQIILISLFLMELGSV